MIFLINASNLRQGGGVQVAQSVCSQLKRFREHRFVIVLSELIDDTKIEFGDNAVVLKHVIKHDLKTIFTGRDSYLDKLVEVNHVDAVLSIFGPSIWRPKVPHLCGFARAQLVLTDSPYYQRLTFKERFTYMIWKWLFKKCSVIFYTENEYISKMLPKIFGDVEVFTVTNYYNQVFDMPESWEKSRQLPRFEGVTCLSVSNYYRHKNFDILVDAVRYLKDAHSDFKVRFVLTFDEGEMPVPDDVKDAFLYIGKVGVDECPYLYEQADVMFMPTLMECFTATYPEAMRMEVPIVTTDLEFARGLCGDAACYYSAVDAKAAAEAIYKVATDEACRSQLIASGKVQLKKFDNYEQRAEKLIGILEEISKK